MLRSTKFAAAAQTSCLRENQIQIRKFQTHTAQLLRLKTETRKRRLGMHRLKLHTSSHLQDDLDALKE
jgi:hypothetical protein